jgi:hypothetical protein
MSLRALVFASAMSAPLAACGYATINYQDANGGVLVVGDFDDSSMEKAREMMISHCGVGKFRVIKRERVVVGAENYSHAQTDYGSRTDGTKDEVKTDHGSTEVKTEDSTAVTTGGETTTAVSGTRDVTEARVTYECVP